MTKETAQITQKMLLERFCEKTLHMNNSKHCILTFQNVTSVHIEPSLLRGNQTIERISSRLLSKSCRSNPQQGAAEIGV